MKAMSVIPAHNEAAHVSGVVSEIYDTGVVDDVIVVDDASTDDTADRAEQAGASVLRNEVNRNYGGAIKRGYTAAIDRGADVIYRLDADGQHNPRQLERFHEQLVEGGVEYVMGNRFTGSDYLDSMPLDRTFGNLVVALLTTVRVRKLIADPACGFRAMDASYLQQTPYHEFSDDFRFGVEELLAFESLDAELEQVSIDCIYADEESSLDYYDGLKYVFTVLGRNQV